MIYEFRLREPKKPMVVFGIEPQLWSDIIRNTGGVFQHKDERYAVYTCIEHYFDFLHESYGLPLDAKDCLGNKLPYEVWEVYEQYKRRIA